MECKIDKLCLDDRFRHRVRATPEKLIARFWFLVCKRTGTHDFEMVLDEWLDGIVRYDDWGLGIDGNLSTTPTVELREARRCCSRHIVLRCTRCGFEYEALRSGVKGCGAHTWFAGREWPVEWHCLPWGDPNATVRVGTSKLPEHVLQINNPEMAHIRETIRV